MFYNLSSDEDNCIDCDEVESGLEKIDDETDPLDITFVKDITSFTKGKTFLQEAQSLYLYEAFSKTVKDWNNLRDECVEMAFTKILYPMLRKELRHKLTREAKDGVINSCRSVLYDWLKVGHAFLP